MKIPTAWIGKVISKANLSIKITKRNTLTRSRIAMAQNMISVDVSLEQMTPHEESGTSSYTIIHL
ncbi:MAG: DUF2577 family protein [Alistipes sp.]|nr:DUF2577 family protein [Alistipes sp.]